tara:strand:+ start:708 stop:1064 length:357 start_codon:yes stop_codon:yes gene_type:complete
MTVSKFKLLIIGVLYFAFGFAVSDAMAGELPGNTSPGLRGELQPASSPMMEFLTAEIEYVEFLIAQTKETPEPSTEEALGEVPEEDLVEVEEESTGDLVVDEVSTITIEAEEEASQEE